MFISEFCVKDENFGDKVFIGIVQFIYEEMVVLKLEFFENVIVDLDLDDISFEVCDFEKCCLVGYLF